VTGKRAKLPLWRRATIALTSGLEKINLVWSAPNLAHWLYRYLWAPVLSIILFYYTPLAEARWGVLHWVGAVITLVLITMLMVGLTHQRGPMCEKCMDREWVADPQAEVEKRMKRLRQYHNHEGRFLCLMFCYTVASSITEAITRPPLWVSATSGSLALIMMGVAEVRWRRVHWRLEAYCPFCHDRGNGGGWMLDPEPDPSEKQPA
jgi:hypothetical protein